MTKQISVIIPVMNEEKNISILANKLKGIFKGKNYEVIFVDDGSNDNTLSEIKKISESEKQVKYVSFTRNFGHQSALMAGIELAKGDAVITMDGDLQHPPELIPKMVALWQEGFDVVYTIRNGKNTKWFKRVTSNCFYWFVNKFSDVKIDPGVADYRLLDRKVVKRIIEMKEAALFLRGLIGWMDFKSTAITYTPNSRRFGETKYSLRKMIYFAIDGITSMSISPLRISSIIGFFLSLASGIYGIYAIALHFTNTTVISGWSSMMISVLFLGGIQLLMLGILGEYVGKTYLETKKRPQYLTQETNITNA